MRGKYKTICDVDRQRIIDAYLSGQSALMISRIMGTKRTTIDYIIKIFIKDGRVKAKKRGGEKRATKLSEEQKHLIKTWIDDDCSITLRKMKQKCCCCVCVCVTCFHVNYQSHVRIILLYRQAYSASAFATQRCRFH
ncbi:hypothetical protein Q1695_015258 [Nippostrongylus brasiliensis]|nr:hypothetical protein Q1695_015258 [Nippostrongylus brasiliensis]